MKLDRLVLINWGQLRPGNYDMGNMTLLTGPTGAGKSTMLDGLQTIMTAAKQGIVAYNPGQEEVQQGQRRGKSKRTLESFVVGAEYSLFSRPEGAQGYIAAVFRPEPNETQARTFTAVVAASARVEGSGERREPKLERLALLLVDNAALSVEEFFEDYARGECIPVEEIGRRLKARHAKVLLCDDHKRDYLCALYGRFRGRNNVPADEAENAARAWSQSIAYRPIGSVHDLVRDQILEFDGRRLQEGIERISDLMRQVTNLKQHGERIEASVKRLRDLYDCIGRTTCAFEDQVQLDLLLARMQLAADKERMVREQERVEDESRKAARATQTVREQQQLKHDIDQNRIQIAARLQGVQAHRDKESLDARLSRATQDASARLADLKQNLFAAARIKQAADQLGAQTTGQPQKLKPAIEAVGRALQQTDVARLGGLLGAIDEAEAGGAPRVDRLRQLAIAFAGVEAGIGGVHHSLVGADESVLTAAVAEAANLDRQLETARSNRDDLSRRKANLAAGRADYPSTTAQALERIQEKLPQACVQVLCDLVEPVSEEWQPAIEGYLDGARFNLIVKPEWEARTIDLLRSSGSRARVIQGKRAQERADPRKVAADSIIHELRTEHPVAQAYLMEQYGSVVKVATSDELRNTARGLTRDGKGSGSMTMFICEPKGLVLGRRARENALQRTIAQLAQQEQELAALDGQQQQLARLRQSLSQLRLPKFEAGPLAQQAGEIEDARRQLAQLDLTEVAQLREELAQIEAVLAEHDTAITRANKATALAEAAIEEARARIHAVEQGLDARFQASDAQLQRLKHLCEANPQKTYTVLSQQVDELLASGSLDLGAAQARLQQRREAALGLLGETRLALEDYNSHAQPEERFQQALPNVVETTAFDPFYGPLVRLGIDVSELHRNLEGIHLYRNRDELQKAEHSFHDVFTKQFCVEIKSKVDDGVRTLRQLNTELEKLKFGTDRYSIDWQKWEPEFHEYYGFFTAVSELADSPEAVDLFNDTRLSPKHEQVRDRLVGLLLDQDQERAGRELLRIADYRNYRRYEIWNDSDSGGRVALSAWGTGSGGQLETPAYIVRAAVVTNRMKLFDRGASLKLLVSDESFSKMDEARARAVLQYLRDSLGLQLISAMPTRNAGGLRPEFDREYSYSRARVERNGDLDFVLECDERVFRKDRMRELWEHQRRSVREQAKLDFEANET